MVKLAISEMDNFSVSDIELKRLGFSYAIDTFKDLQKLLGKQAKMFYIMGVDSLNDILSWKKPLELLKMCEVIVATRPKTSIRTFRRLLKFPPLMKFSDKIHLIEVNSDVSSSEIRKLLRTGKSVKKFLSPSVIAYIKEHGLYQTDESTK
jgi:nicotinate-nucleotide adenylyltransferase